MKYIVYQTTNLKNNKIYIGVHKCLNPDIFDSYIGCGIKVNNPSSYMNPTTPLQHAVKKYGTSSFRRITLKVFDSLEEAFNLEKELVDAGIYFKRRLVNDHNLIVSLPKYKFIFDSDFETGVLKIRNSIKFNQKFSQVHNPV